jgi:hypothetical protein
MAQPESCVAETHNIRRPGTAVNCWKKPEKTDCSRSAEFIHLTGLKEHQRMFPWLKARFRKLLEQADEKEIQRLLRERERLRTALIKANGGKPNRLTAEQRARLDALRKKLDPELAKKYDLLADYE